MPSLVQRVFFAYRDRRWVRSEEHTSELQSQSNLVCRLLLEKKNIRHLLAAHVDLDGFLLDGVILLVAADLRVLYDASLILDGAGLPLHQHARPLCRPTQRLRAP